MVANNMWKHRDNNDFYADLLNWAIPDVFTRALNEQATDKSLDDAWNDALEA